MPNDICNHRLVKEDIELQPWLPLQFSGHHYLLKSFFNSTLTSYSVILYRDNDMGMWYENVDFDEFIKKCQQYNHSIESTPSKLFTHLERCVENCWKSSTLQITHGDKENVSISIKGSIKDNIPFSWEFMCSKCDLLMVNSILVNPLFIMVKEMLRREQLLFSIIQRKDNEIQDYKDQGYTISRKHLKTLKFDKSAFRQSCAMNEEFHSNCVLPPTDILANSSISNLYRNVMVNKQASSHNDITVKSPSVPFDTLPVDSMNKGAASLPWSSGIQNPTSIILDKVGETSQTSSEPVPLEKVEISENDEMRRREAIRLRLDEDERKSKKKKRKINI